MARSPYDRVNAIPTTYKGVEFRSRLEARWAAFFDLAGWAWEYESVDLAGYIPDFVLPDFATSLIVEVKPAMQLEDFEPARLKIERSGWTGHALILGSRQNFVRGPGRMMSPGIAGKATDIGWVWSPTVIGCRSCRGNLGIIVAFDDILSCLRCGERSGGRFDPEFSASDLWVAAGNAVQYTWSMR